MKTHPTVKPTPPDHCPRIRDLPENERGPFSKWLNGQTVPRIVGERMENQDGYYSRDYERWKRGLPIVD